MKPVPAVLEHHFDPKRHIDEVPESATMIGLFFQDVLKSLKLPPQSPRLRALASRSYRGFLRYSHRDWLEIVTLVASEAHPGVSTAEGIRRVGRSAYAQFVSTMLGRTIFGVAGRDVDAVFSLGPKGFNTVMGGISGEVSAHHQDVGHWRYVFRRYPAFIDTYCVGVIEGVFDHFGVKGELAMSESIFFDGEIDIRWQ